jgi:ubiquinone/menaquinone biosynthesis C-methylase UbiE
VRLRRRGLAILTLLSGALLVAGCAGRALEREREQVISALRLQAGMQVADVGAGQGDWSKTLARAVGEQGHVFATEIKEEHVRRIRERLARAGFANVTTVLGSDLETGLPDDCCDAILLRRVYHHFTEPERMRAELRRALRSGGRLAVIEIRTQKHWGGLPGVPDRGGHGIDPDDLREEMESDGWTVLDQHDEWGDEKDGYCLIFQEQSR